VFHNVPPLPHSSQLHQTLHHLHLHPMPARNASAPSQTTVYLYSTRHSFRRQHLYTPHHISAVRLPIHARHPKCAIVEPLQ
jgi:hypothetical protein